MIHIDPPSNITITVTFFRASENNVHRLVLTFRFYFVVLLFGKQLMLVSNTPIWFSFFKSFFFSELFIGIMTYLVYINLLY